MLTEAQFKILKTVYLCSEQTLTQRALAAQTRKGNADEHK